MSEHPVAYPLQWPMGWSRTRDRKPSRFGHRQRGLSPYEGATRVLRELEYLGISRADIVISTNVRTRVDGLPRANAPPDPPNEPGVAIYWRRLSGRRYESRCMAIDLYTTVGANLGAVAATLDAMRAIERHGGAPILDRVFQGFIALPALEQWFTILGVTFDASREEILRAHAQLAWKHHPDRGGDNEVMSRINTARDEGLAR